MALYIPHSIFHLARLLYLRPQTFGPYYVRLIIVNSDFVCCRKMTTKNEAPQSTRGGRLCDLLSCLMILGMPAQRNGNQRNNTSFQVIRVVLLKAQVFRDVTECRLASSYLRSERAYLFQTSVKSISPSAAASQNTSINRINVTIFDISFNMSIITGCELKY